MIFGFNFSELFLLGCFPFGVGYAIGHARNFGCFKFLISFFALIPFYSTFLENQKDIALVIAAFLCGLFSVFIAEGEVPRLQIPFRLFSSVLALGLAFSLTACGTLTGIPGHGGGKRFAIEQELVAGTARAAAKDLNLEALRGRTVAIYLVGMGDEGSGNLIGGRYSIDALLRGEHVSTPVTEYPVLTTTTTTGTVTTIAQNALNAPRRTEGSGHNLSGGIGFSGLGAYRSEAILNPRDAQFLSAVVQSSFALRGVKVVPSAEAEVDVYITVDVFGTIRSRHDWHIANQESLIAKTALEMTAIDRETGEVIVPPQTTSFEAEYNEQYMLWAGPVHTTKSLRRSDGVLSDFTDLGSQQPVERRKPIVAPFPN